MLAACLKEPNEALRNIEGAHRVHGWPTPLKVVNVTLSGSEMLPLVVMNDIGEPKPYVRDVVSNALAETGTWEITKVADIATAAGLSLPDGGTFLDVGAQLGVYSMAAAIGLPAYRVIAIEPMQQNIVAFAASRCLHPEAGARIEVLQTAAVAPRQRQHASSCAVFSPFKGNDVGNGKLECVNRSGAAQCSRRHEGKTISANFTYFFHYRRFCQLVPSPLRTLDDILLQINPPLTSVTVAKIDTAGSECDILAGSGQTLFGKFRPKLLLISVDTAKREACVRLLAEERGFKVHPFTPAVGQRRRPRTSNGNPSMPLPPPTKHVVLVDAGNRKS